MPQYYVEGNHEAIIPKPIFFLVQEEMFRRAGLNKAAVTRKKNQKSKYSSQYALTGILLCGDCRQEYRRVTWARNGNKKIVWRCSNRLQNGVEECGASPTIEESVLHDTIPVMWLCWNDDCCFSINSNSHSYVRTVRNNSKTVLSMCHLMHHSHTHAMLRQESYWYAERIISGQDVPHIDAYIKGRKLLFSCTEAPKSIKLYYITGKLAYSRREKYGMNDIFLDRDWQILKVDTQASDVNLPNDAAGCYLEIILENDIVFCSQYFDQFLQNGETV